VIGLARPRARNGMILEPRPSETMDLQTGDIVRGELEKVR